MAEKTYYEILGVSFDADEQEIRQAYRQKIKEQHPDHNPDDPRAIRWTRRLNEARETLLDPDKRLRYDEQLRRKGIIPDEGVSNEGAKPDDATSPPDDSAAGADEYTFAPEYERPTDEQVDDGFNSHTYQEKTSSDHSEYQTAGAERSRESWDAIRKRRHPVKLIIQLTAYTLGGLGGIALAIMILWFGFKKDPFGLFQNRVSPIAQQSAESVSKKVVTNPKKPRAIPPPLPEAIPKNNQGSGSLEPMPKPLGKLDELEQAISNGDYARALQLEPTNKEALAQKTTAVNTLVKLWAWNEARQLVPELRLNMRIELFSSPVMCIAQSGDHNMLATGYWDGSVKVLDYANGKEVVLVEGHDTVVFSLDISPDGNRMATSSADQSACIWDLATGKKLHSLDQHDGWVHSVSFSPDGEKILTGSDDGFVRVWNIASEEIVYKKKFIDAVILAVAYSPDGKHFACGTSNGDLFLRNDETGANNTLNNAHEAPVMSLAFSPGSKQIVSGSWDKTVRIWDAFDGTQLYEPMFGHDDWINSVAFSPDGKTIVSGSIDKTIRIWDAESGLKRAVFNGHADSVNCVRFSTNGDTILSASTDKTIRYWALGRTDE